jgi:hypothetical protein
MIPVSFKSWLREQWRAELWRLGRVPRRDIPRTLAFYTVPQLDQGGGRFLGDGGYEGADSGGWPIGGLEGEGYSAEVLERVAARQAIERVLEGEDVERVERVRAIAARIRGG